MKTTLMIITMGLLFSCTQQEPPKSTKLYGSSEHIEAIIKDIQTKYASFSIEQKLDLCVLDFAFADPEFYADLVVNRPKDMKATLLANEQFVRICKSRSVDPNDMPDDYFAEVE